MARLAGGVEVLAAGALLRSAPTVVCGAVLLVSSALMASLGTATTWRRRATR